MIRIVATGLEALIDAEKPLWRTTAAAYTAQLQIRGSYHDKALGGVSPPDWSDIKPAFMRLQNNRCAYCERGLETAHELDVEHFRPKRRVKPWEGSPSPPAHGRVDGYYWLAYDVRNYCVACKPCNSALKSDYFPIAGLPGGRHEDVSTLYTSELPLLLFPLGDLDDDPETVIGWDVLTPVPLAPTGTHTYNRAETTISFFQLDGREELDRQRATALWAVWPFLEKELDESLSQAEREVSRAHVERYVKAPKTMMRACVRAFVEKARRNPVEAKKHIPALIAFITPP